jgi:hypothetical protein
MRSNGTKIPNHCVGQAGVVRNIAVTSYAHLPKDRSIKHSNAFPQVCVEDIGAFDGATRIFESQPIQDCLSLPGRAAIVQQSAEKAEDISHYFIGRMRRMV